MSRRTGRTALGVLGAVCLVSLLLSGRIAQAHLMPPRNTVGDYALRATAIAVVRISESAPAPVPEQPWTGPSPVASGDVVRILKAPEGKGPPGWPERAEWSFVAPGWPVTAAGRLTLVFLEQPPGSDRWNSSQTDKDQFDLEGPLDEAHPWLRCVKDYMDIAAMPPEPVEAHNRGVKERLMSLMANPVPRVRRDALEEALRFNEFWKVLSDEDVARLVGYVEDKSADGPFRFRLGVVLHLLHDRIPDVKKMALLKACDEPPLKAALIKLVGTCRQPECGQAILPLIEDEDPNVRLTAFAQAAHYPSPEAAETLVARLPREDSYYYKKDIVDALLGMGQAEGLAGLERFFKNVPDADKLKRHYERRLRRLKSEGKLISTAPSNAESPPVESGHSARWIGAGALALLILMAIALFRRRPTAS